MVSTTALRPALTRDDPGALLGKTMGLVAATAGLFAVGAYLGRDLAYGWGLLFFVASLALLLGLNVAAERSERAALTVLFASCVPEAARCDGCRFLDRQRLEASQRSRLGSLLALRGRLSSHRE